jgi:hypothetical protein
MSWDFYMDVDVGGPEPLSVQDGINYTTNVSGMYKAAMGGGGIRQLAGKTGRECLAILRLAILAMEDDPAKYKSMNPSNGWGDSESAIGLLRELSAWCVEAPRAVMRIC